jgi:hypothetical protein
MEIKLIRANGTVVDFFFAHEYVKDISYKGHYIRCTVKGDWISSPKSTVCWTNWHSGILAAFEYIDKLQGVKF